MTDVRGFIVTEDVRRSEPVMPDPFIATLEPEREEPGAAGGGDLPPRPLADTAVRD